MNDFNINLDDQFLNGMTSYNDQWMTWMTIFMTSYWIEWHHTMTIEAPQAKKLMKKDCRNKIWLSGKCTSRNSACSTSLQSQLAKYKVLTLGGPPTSRCKIGPKITEKLETSSKTTKTSRKRFKEQTPVLDEIHTKEFNLFNITKSAPNEQVKLETSSKSIIFGVKFCH